MKNNIFIPSYDPNFVLSTQQNNEVYFANADPGTGKTYASLQIALNHLGTGNCILVYAAPTNKLLNQFENDFIKLVKQHFKEDASFLLKTYFARIDSNRLPKHITVKDVFIHRTLGSEKYHIPSMQDGSVLLITHSCLEKLNIKKGKDRISLIYDEARQCLVGEYKINVPLHLLRYLFKDVKFLKREKFYRASINTITNDDDLMEIDESESVLSNSKEKNIDLPEYFDYEDCEPDLDDVYTVRYRVKDIDIWRWNTEIPKRKLNRSVIREVWRNTLDGGGRENDKKLNENQVKAFFDILDKIQNEQFDVYVDIKSIKKKKHKKNKQVKINVISSPSRMFDGFGKVLILSAFFSYSQMYYILSNDSKIELIDVTNKIIDRRRKLAMCKRMHRCFISYIFEEGSLSKRHLLRSIVLKGNKPTSEQEKVSFPISEDINKQWRKAYFKDNMNLNSYGSKQPLHYRDFLNLEIQDIDELYRGSATHQNMVLDALNYYKGSVLRFMVYRAKEIQKGFIKRLQEKFGIFYKEDLPITINKTLNDPANLRKNISNLWKYERFDKISGIQKLPTDNRGLNVWKEFHTIAFLATMKHDEGEVEFLRKVIPLYRPEVDRTLDFCIQSIFRCNMRNPLSQDPCLVILSDRTLAEELKERIPDLRILSPSFLYQNFKVGKLLTYAEPEEDRKKRKEETQQALKNYHSSEELKEAKRLNVGIQYWKEKLKKDPSNEKAKQKLHEFQIKRKKLIIPTLASFRK
jgi:hypothetical protein